MQNINSKVFSFCLKVQFWEKKYFSIYLGFLPKLNFIMKKFVIIEFFHQNWWGKINFDEFRAKIRNYTILIFPFLNSKCSFKKLKKINFDAFLGKNSKCIFANKIKNIYRSWAKNNTLKLFPKIEVLDKKIEVWNNV